MQGLTENEIVEAKRVIAAGLVKAAESLSFFMNEKVTLKPLDGEENMDIPGPLGKKGQENIHLMITKVIGDIKGVCWLIFSEEEANILRSTALPADMLSNPEIMAEMSDGIMLEVDNIISASVITQFSNMLKVKIHGGVPHLIKLNYEEMTKLLDDERENEKYFINFKTSFESSIANFNPEFLWLFNDDFLESIKKIAENELK